jgi:hypothetical protein
MTAAKETTLDTLLSTMERGFAAVASDIGEVKSEVRNGGPRQLPSHAAELGDYST